MSFQMPTADLDEDITEERKEGGPTKTRGRWRTPTIVRAFNSDWRSRLGVWILGGLILFSLVGPLIFPGDPNAADYTIPPNQPPSVAHWLGTDQGGRDMFLQLVHGAWPSLFVGLAVGILATALATAVGLVAGVAGRGTDGLLTLVTNVFLLVPGLPLVIVVASFIESDSNLPIIVILAITGWAFGARVLRSQALSIGGRDFITAAIVRGESKTRIVFREILPNMMALVGTVFVGASAGAIAAMAGLQFLGLGDISQVNWYTSLYWAQNYGAVMTGSWWTFVPVGLAIAVSVTSLSLINYGIDALSNPRIAIGRARRRSAPDEQPAQEHPASALLEVRDLVVTYGDEVTTPTVDRVSFAVRGGEVLGIAGESGSGKSTSIHAILRLGGESTRAKGEAWFDGVELLAAPYPAIRSLRWNRISLVSQSSMNAMSPVRTVADHFIDTMQAHRRWTRRECLERASESMKLVGIAPTRLTSYPHQLSGGMRQRVMIALALCLDPDMVVMDEPTTALDVVVQREILQRVKDLQKRLGFALIFITHDLGLLIEISDDIAVMRHGRIVEQLPAADFIERASDPYTHVLLNSLYPERMQKGA